MRRVSTLYGYPGAPARSLPRTLSEASSFRGSEKVLDYLWPSGSSLVTLIISARLVEREASTQLGYCQMLVLRLGPEW